MTVTNFWVSQILGISLAALGATTCFVMLIVHVLALIYTHICHELYGLFVVHVLIRLMSGM
jgi:hypothetical protein